MAARDPVEVPVSIRRLCRRFERWRTGDKARLPIPEVLWSAAVDQRMPPGTIKACGGKIRCALVSPLGRGTTEYCGTGENDVLSVLADVNLAQGESAFLEGGPYGRNGPE